jgi:cell division control protein 7
MTTAVQQHVEESFDIHEDLRTEDTEMMAEEERTEEAAPMDDDEDVREFQQHQNHHMQQRHAHQQHHQTSHHQPQPEPQEEEEDELEEEESEEEAVDRSVQADMDKLQSDFPGFRNRYRLIKRIGEGMQALSLIPQCHQLILTNTYRNVLDCLQSRGYNV